MCLRVRVWPESAQDDLIASLKRELASSRALSSESKSLRADLHAARSEASNRATENARLVSETKSLGASLQAAQNEAKSLSTKLAATRNAAPASDGSSASRGAASVAKNPVGKNGAGGGNMEVKEAQMSRLKEDLYSDLTGLIVRGVKKGEGEDVYDCIQTGRNGSEFPPLSINLFISNYSIFALLVTMMRGN